MAHKGTKTRKATKKHSSNAWFVPVRGSYLPNTWQGWLTYIPFISYLVAVMVSISDITTSWFMKIMMITVQFVAAAVVMTWVAASHS